MVGRILSEQVKVVFEYLGCIKKYQENLENFRIIYSILFFFTERWKWRCWLGQKTQKEKEEKNSQKEERKEKGKTFFKGEKSEKES